MDGEKRKAIGLVMVVIYMTLTFLLIVRVGSCGLRYITGRAVGKRANRMVGNLNASVRFKSGNFIIENKDSFDWTNTALWLNFLLPGANSHYVAAGKVKAGERYVVEAEQFHRVQTKQDFIGGGFSEVQLEHHKTERFNSSESRILTLDITSDGGIWKGSFE